jgi:hypothetical protein
MIQTINNRGYNGKSISIINNKIIIDGVDVTPNSKTINITIDGNVDNLSVDVCNNIIVNGDVNKLTTSSGDIDCDDVLGDIKTISGEIECGKVGGNISTISGDVKCKNVTGNVKTNSGNIKHIKND